MDAWAEYELDGGTFPDPRLKKRLGKVLGDLGQRLGKYGAVGVPGLGRDQGRLPVLRQPARR
ncbi:transposase DNA-binding-containing protein [Gemmata sp.]|uniref:transposase DNA-binding-containing protein n=1 Tax=Gemmata sp. TaxID=1914242 RepID=UPI003F6EA792